MKLKNTSLTILESYQKEMINGLHTARDVRYFKKKISELKY